MFSSRSAPLSEGGIKVGDSGAEKAFGLKSFSDIGTKTGPKTILIAAERLRKRASGSAGHCGFRFFGRASLHVGHDGFGLRPGPWRVGELTVIQALDRSTEPAVG
jgi:hypothetical protein